MSDDDVDAARTVADEAADPATDPERLYRIVSDHPELRTEVAANPAIYPELRAWLAGLGDPDIDAALELADARADAGALPATPAAGVPAPGAGGATRPAGPAARPAPRPEADVERTVVVPGAAAGAASGAVGAAGAAGAATSSYPSYPPGAGASSGPADASYPSYPAGAGGSFAPAAAAAPSSPSYPAGGGSPPPGPGPGPSPASPWKIATIVLAVALLALVGWLYLRSRGDAEDTAGGTPTSPATGDLAGDAAGAATGDATAAPTSPPASPTATPTVSGTPSASPTPTPEEVVDPLEALETRRQESLEVATFDGHWVVQLSSKYDGQVDPYEFTSAGSHTFYLADIWREHQQLTDLLAVRDVPVYLFEARDVGRQRERHDLYWVTIADPGGLASREEAQAYCAALYPDRSGDHLENSCVARELLPPFWP